MEKLKKWHIAGGIVGIVLGTLLHFVYDWSNQNILVAIFGSVNESTWEHCKLLFWPLLFFAVVEYFTVGKNYPNYWYAKTVSLYLGVFAIIAIFYTYTGILGDNYFILDLLVFLAGIIISQYSSFKILGNKNNNSKSDCFALVLLVLLGLSFIVFTFYPPRIPLFADPRTGDYGVNTE